MEPGCLPDSELVSALLPLPPTVWALAIRGVSRRASTKCFTMIFGELAKTCLAFSGAPCQCWELQRLLWPVFCPQANKNAPFDQFTHRANQMPSNALQRIFRSVSNWLPLRRLSDLRAHFQGESSADSNSDSDWTTRLCGADGGQQSLNDAKLCWFGCDCVAPTWSDYLSVTWGWGDAALKPASCWHYYCAVSSCDYYIIANASCWRALVLWAYCCRAIITIKMIWTATTDSYSRCSGSGSGCPAYYYASVKHYDSALMGCC